MAPSAGHLAHTTTERLEKDDNEWIDVATGGVMNCVVHGLEHALSHPEEPHDSKSVTASSSSSAKSEKPKNEVVRRDFVKLHDDFLESLLQEQMKRQQESPLPPDQVLDASWSSSSSSLQSTENKESSSLIFTHRQTSPKKTRAIKFSRRSPRRPTVTGANSRQIAPLDSSSLVSEFVSERELPPPESFIHDQCKLQKDKGKGEEPGACICATGRIDCLEKLRQKMQLLMQVGSPTSKAAAPQRKRRTSMKRRKARITDETVGFVETRSVIELKMGFLSMQYGVLIRWDSANSGQILLVVLRKMCHDSFYKKEMPIKKKLIRHAQNDASTVYIQYWARGNYLIAQRTDATEVSLLEPPYRVERPLSFAPTVMTVSVLRMIGFSVRLSWTIQVTFDGITRRTKLAYDPHKGIHLPCTEQEFDWEVPEEMLDLTLDISIFENRRTRGKRKKPLSREFVPLNFLETTPTNHVSHKRTMTIPFENQGKVVLSVLHQSDYIYWLSQEIDARKKDYIECAIVPTRKVIVVERSVPPPSVTEFCCLC